MMPAFVKRFLAKARSRSGESMTEVLVAIVVSGLAILMLATAIAAAANTNARSRVLMDQYYADNNELATGSGTAAPGVVTLTEHETSTVVRLVDGADAVRVNGTVYAQSGDVAVVTYETVEEG